MQVFAWPWRPGATLLHQREGLESTSPQDTIMPDAHSTSATDVVGTCEGPLSCLSSPTAEIITRMLKAKGTREVRRNTHCPEVGVCLVLMTDPAGKLG